MADSTRLQEPVVDRWSEQVENSAKKRQSREITASIFSLSGGVMKSRSGNKIDYLLARMLQEPNSTYIPNIDRNLDCLYTSLQLEMIGNNAMENAQPQAEDDSARQLRPKTDEMR